jgi:hypothetical protein
MTSLEKKAGKNNYKDEHQQNHLKSVPKDWVISQGSTRTGCLLFHHTLFTCWVWIKKIHNCRALSRL